MTLRRAKIVCTIGPASDSEELIEKLALAGMDCARLNFSHGNHEGHAKVAARVRAVAAKVRRPLAILADLCGPKMRIGRFTEGSIELEVGQRFTLTSRSVEGNREIVSMSYEPLAREVKPGDHILLDDGLLALRVESTTAQDVVCIVEVGGTLSNNKGMNIPGSKLSTPALTAKDKKDLEFAVHELGVDYLALSFVRSAEDVREAQELAGRTPIIAKIEKPEAVEALNAILDAADGVMIARGDLGVEVGAEKVPLIQKRIIREANERGKVVITATQMLDSMIRNPRPTRAEAADVANAILDGTDAVMLSAESASGRYPIESVSMMSAIIHEVEASWLADPHHHASHSQQIQDWGFSTAAAQGAALFSFVLPLKALVDFTHDGRSAVILSKHRPKAPVIAVTDDHRVASRLALYWGVVPRLEIPPEDLAETLRLSTALLVRENICKPGDDFAMVVGWPLSGSTNTVKLHRL